MTEEELAALGDPASSLFTPAEKAALRFSEGMTGDSNGVSDSLFAELRAHFDEGQVIELVLVAGVFNYFNRINNALRTEITR
ncbi:MAG: carboxymuconolactone decarboxylase family protein [Planctomycetes bacterium]|nr:carboxymuconolactone decarboxylase family protein [Planctomycetota bacterium]